MVDALTLSHICLGLIAEDIWSWPPEEFVRIFGVVAYCNI